MKKQTLILNADYFSDLGTFYHEIDNVFTKNLEWKTGHNLEAFNDLLRGGFGVYEYGEPIKLVWENFSKSQQDLGQKLIDTLVEIIHEHVHIEFIMNE